VVIAVLAVIWVIALTPMMLRKLSERRFTTSVNSFHRQLLGMRRAYPRLVASAADPEMALSMTETTYSRTRESSLPPTTQIPRTEPVDRYQRRPAPQAARRRRVLLTLGAVMLGCFLLGMIPGLKVLWGLSLLAFAAGAAYLALLIHIHRCAVERAAKVVDIRDHRRDPDLEVPVTAPVAVVVAPGAVGAARRNAPDDVAWADDEWLGSVLGFDYDETMAGGR